jgi:hypothetical protein
MHLNLPHGNLQGTIPVCHLPVSVKTGLKFSRREDSVRVCAAPPDFSGGGAVGAFRLAQGLAVLQAATGWASIAFIAAWSKMAGHGVG